ncbi:MAG TPA: aldo/keto reductase [Leptospiraceae bacterium]|nr:aldo/keto reductase [Leptospiraceae bacterium]
MSLEISRAQFLRRFLLLGGAVGITLTQPMQLSRLFGIPRPDQELRKRPIPGYGETIPVVGLGTWQAFDYDDPESLVRLRTVLELFHAAGGRVIDSSPMYGLAEEVIGRLRGGLDPESPNALDLFTATKVWTRGDSAGRRQIQNSFSLLKEIDLLQVHNLLDLEVHWPYLQELKATGKIRYTGITHYTESGYDDLMNAIRKYDVDFAQFNYNVLAREAEKELLPLCMEKQVAVLINRPFGGGEIFSRVKGQELPAWMRKAGILSWSNAMLKFVLSHPAVTCVIPGTGKPDHLLDNMNAGRGELPDQETREQIARHFEVQT